MCLLPCASVLFRYLISVLPDHGAKIRSKIVQLQTLIRSKEDLEEAMDQLSHLKLSKKLPLKHKIGQYGRFVTVKGGPDSDDDEDSDGDDGDDDDVGGSNVGDDSNSGDVGDSDSANGDISQSKVESMDGELISVHVWYSETSLIGHLYNPIFSLIRPLYEVQSPYLSMVRGTP